MSRRNHSRRTAIAAVLTAAVLTPTLTGVQPAAAAGLTLTVHAAVAVRPVTHVAAGGLYGVDAATPSLERLLPLHLNSFTQPPPDTQQLGNGATTPCCDALKVAAKITNAGAQQYIRMPDIFSQFPYNWTNWADYEAKVDTMVRKRLAATGATNIAGWELWNEPDGTWPSAAGDYLAGWTRLFRDVRALDTATPIIGPGWATYGHDKMYNFMLNAKNTNTLPQVAVWHELQDFSYNNIESHMADFRAIEDSLGLPHRPVSINEYASPPQVDIPSIGVHYMASLERAGVHDAERAYWYEAATLDGLLYNDQPTASYWAYKWYGDQSGNIVQTVPQSYLDGVASYDASRKQVNVVFGGDSGANTVVVDGLAPLGSSVRVTLSRTDTGGRFTNQAAPTVVSTSTYTPSNGKITVPVAGMSDQAAYQLLVTPASGATTWQQTYEAENATVQNAQTRTSTTASNGSYVGGLDNNTDMRTDSFIDFLVNVPAAGAYSMSVKYANATGANATQGLAYNGGAYSSITYPPTSAGWGNPNGTARTTVNLRSGYNMIRLAKGAPNFAGGVGFAEIDNITLATG